MLLRVSVSELAFARSSARPNKDFRKRKYLIRDRIYQNSSKPFLRFRRQSNV